MSRTIFGNKFSAPFFICPAGGAKVSNPGGDICLTKAAGRHDILHWVCNNASFNVEEIANARVPEQTTYWQIYAMTDLTITEKEVKHAISLGYKGFALTVDAIWAGKREFDVRAGLSETEADDDDDEEEDEDDGFSKEPSVTRP
jgi:L-lactate dehydrogenase (cytochrome)